MKFIKGGNLAKLVAFFLIVTILTCTVAFASGGWQSFTEGDSDSDDIAGGVIPPDGNVDENTDGNNGVTPPPQDEPAPVFTHYLTGLTVTAEEAARAPLAFVYSSTDPIYGLSYAFLTVEIPTEDGKTRLLGVTTGSDYIGKIGSIAPSRDYINAVAKRLGITLIHKGNDDSFAYSDVEFPTLDLTVHGGYSYTEYTEYHYTNSDLVSALFKNTATSSAKDPSVLAPFTFSSATVRGDKSASTVVIPYAEGNETSLIYDAATSTYTLYKSSGAIKDLLNDKSCNYANAFVLYANSTTYETQDATETVIDTVSGGVGYYFTMGTVQRISWTSDGGNLVFLDEDGQRLAVNCGTSYIAFERASKINNTTYN